MVNQMIKRDIYKELYGKNTGLMTLGDNELTIKRDRL